MTAKPNKPALQRPVFIAATVLMTIFLIICVSVLFSAFTKEASGVQCASLFGAQTSCLDSFLVLMGFAQIFYNPISIAGILVMLILYIADWNMVRNSKQDSSTK